MFNNYIDNIHIIINSLIKISVDITVGETVDALIV